MPGNLMPEPDARLVDVLLEDHRWADVALGALAEQAARATLGHLGLEPDAFEIALLGCDDARIATLNTQFRNRDGATNVLSWPAQSLASTGAGGAPADPVLTDAGGPTGLGDIAISYDTCQREAQAQNKTFCAHTSHLLVHGCLHLLGYDHIRDKDAALMERLEVEILANLGIANPY